MEENKYKIENIQKINNDISEQKKAKIKHTANCAAYAIVTAYLSTLSIISQNIVSTAIGLSFGGVVATLSVLEMINVNKRKKMLNDLIEVRDKLVKENEEEIKNRGK